MDGRISAALLLFIAPLVCVGCVTTQSQTAVEKPNTTTTSETVVKMDDTPKVVKKADGPKRNPMPSTEIALGKIKETEADTEAAKKYPEIQSQLRDDARKAYQHALQIDPNNLDAFHHLGRIYVKMGDYDRAQEIYKKALAKHPKDGSLWSRFHVQSPASRAP